MFTSVQAAPVLALGGSRRLSSAGVESARLITQALLTSGHRLAVGCATGTDAAVINSAVSSRHARQLQIFTAFGPITGPLHCYAVAGSGSCSAPDTVAHARHAGAKVTAWAGGGPGLDFTSRLANRTRAVARASTHGGVVLVDGVIGPGSALLVRSLAARGLPVWLVPVGWVDQYPLPVDGFWRWGWQGFGFNLPCWHLPGIATQASFPLCA